MHINCRPIYFVIASLVKIKKKFVFVSFQYRPCYMYLVTHQFTTMSSCVLSIYNSMHAFVIICERVMIIIYRPPSTTVFHCPGIGLVFSNGFMRLCGL